MIPGMCMMTVQTHQLAVCLGAGYRYIIRNRERPKRSLENDVDPGLYGGWSLEIGTISRRSTEV